MLNPGTLIVSMAMLCTMGACSTSPSQTTDTVRYQCDRGTQLSVLYKQDQDMAVIQLEDGTSIELPASPAASGFLYTNGRYALRGKGNEAQWSIGRMAAETCLAISNAP
jgi:membrane-bound inhibitor of C-type lysozyme